MSANAPTKHELEMTAMQWRQLWQDEKARRIEAEKQLDESKRVPTVERACVLCSLRKAAATLVELIGKAELPENVPTSPVEFTGEMM